MIRISCKVLGSSAKTLRSVGVGYVNFTQRNIRQNDVQHFGRSGIRFSSSFGIAETPSLVQEIVQTGLTVEPTLSSLGLGGLTPKGLVQSGLELLHTGLDIPWWSAIVIGTVCIRIAIFPLVIICQRNAANMSNHMPTLQRLQQKATKARMSGDPMEAVAASTEIMQFMKTNNVNPLKNLLTVAAQIPIFLSVFTGLREMTGLPVESMKTGGILWFPDLTIPDPIYALPLLTAATLFATIEVGVDGIKASQFGHSSIKLFLRAMPLVSIPFMINFPSAMLCYWFTSNTFSLIQVLILKIPRVKNFFSIPEIVNHDTAYAVKEVDIPKTSFMESLKLNMKNLEMAREIHERKQLDALKMKEPSTKMESKAPEKGSKEG